MIHLEFLDEDEEQVKCTLIEDDGNTTVKLGDDPYEAVERALFEVFGGGDLGDLFWPLQNE